MSGVCLVTCVDDDEPLKWGWELGKIVVPTVVFCSAAVAPALRQSGVSPAVRLVESEVPRPLAPRDKHALLRAAGRVGHQGADRYFWLDIALVYQHLSFAFLYSDLLVRWLGLVEPDPVSCVMPGYPASGFFGGSPDALAAADALFEDLPAVPAGPPGSVSDLPAAFTPTAGARPAADLNLNLASVITEPVLHVAGDSHVLNSLTRTAAIGCRTHVLIRTPEASAIPVPYAYQFTHHLGGRTMHHAGRPGALLEAAERFWLKDGDAVVWVFGEIDVRSHIMRQHQEEQRSVEEVVDTLVRGYVRSILEVQRAYARLRQLVFAPIPPLDNPNYESHDLPVHGTIEARIAVTRQLRAALRVLCDRHDVGYLETPAHFETERGDLQWDLSDHFCHIGSAYQGPIVDGLYALLAAPRDGATPAG